MGHRPFFRRGKREPMVVFCAVLTPGPQVAEGNPCHDSHITMKFNIPLFRVKSACT